MASQPTRTVALMSIHPRYAGLILNGRKRVEFRRTRIRGSVSHVLIYETAPVQCVTGFFEVAGVDEAEPQAIFGIATNPSRVSTAWHFGSTSLTEERHLPFGWVESSRFGSRFGSPHSRRGRSCLRASGTSPRGGSRILARNAACAVGRRSPETLRTQYECSATVTPLYRVLRFFCGRRLSGRA